MTRILLPRHGETDWNREGRFRGRIDVPLTDRGQAQAEACARHVAARWAPTALYSVNVLESDGVGLRVVTLNDVSHLTAPERQKG